MVVVVVVMVLEVMVLVVMVLEVMVVVVVVVMVLEVMVAVVLEVVVVVVLEVVVVVLEVVVAVVLEVMVVVVVVVMSTFFSSFSPSFLHIFIFFFCLPVPLFPTPHFLPNCFALIVTNVKFYTLSCLHYSRVGLLLKAGSITSVHGANQPAGRPSGYCTRRNPDFFFETPFEQYPEH
jgi:hypothetical protein